MEQLQPSLSNFRTLLPVTLPFIFGFLTSGCVLILGSAAYHAASCGLALPWSAATSLDILEGLAYAMAREVHELRQLSSSCVADLHADVSLAYVFCFVVAMLSGILSFPLTGMFKPEPMLIDRRAYRKGVLAILLLGVFLVSFPALVLNGLAIINFLGERRRISVSFNGEYISLLSYWLVIQTLIFMLSFGLWWVCAGAALLWRGRGVKSSVT
jgi:hypothetical protein